MGDVDRNDMLDELSMFSLREVLSAFFRPRFQNFRLFAFWSCSDPAAGACSPTPGMPLVGVVGVKPSPRTGTGEDCEAGASVAPGGLLLWLADITSRATEPERGKANLDGSCGQNDAIVRNRPGSSIEGAMRLLMERKLGLEALTGCGMRPLLRQGMEAEGGGLGNAEQGRQCQPPPPWSKRRGRWNQARAALKRPRSPKTMQEQARGRWRSRGQASADQATDEIKGRVADGGSTDSSQADAYAPKPSTGSVRVARGKMSQAALRESGGGCWSAVPTGECSALGGSGQRGAQRGGEPRGPNGCCSLGRPASAFGAEDKP